MGIPGWNYWWSGGIGSAGSSNNGGTGGSGGNTTFGTSLLVAGGATGGAYNALGGAGGTASLGSGPVGIALAGATGTANLNSSATISTTGPGGAVSPFGGAGYGNGPGSSAGGSAVSNSGSGGGGAGGPNSGGSGSAGGAGGYIEAIIVNPSSTYSYTVGTGGTGGAAGTNGSAGGAGGSGYIEVTEYYANGAVGTATNITGVLNYSSLPPVNMVTSASCGAFVAGSGTQQPVTNLSVSITTHGRPVEIKLQPDGTTNSAFIGSLSGATLITFFQRNGVTVAESLINNPTAGPLYCTIPPPYTDSPAAGTYTYSVEYLNSTNNGQYNYLVLVAREL